MSDVILFAVYAVFAWYLAARWRRTWRGFASQAVAVGLLILAIRFLLAKGRDDLDDPGRYASMVVLLSFEVGLVALVGLLICCMPRAAPSPRHCFGCHYDLTGLLAPEGGGPLTCPECGAPCRPGAESEGLIPIPKTPPGGWPRKINL